MEKTSDDASLSRVQSKKLEPRSVGENASLFHPVKPSESGIDFVHSWAPDNQSERDLIATVFAGGAVALGDIDSDGLPEILLTRWVSTLSKSRWIKIQRHHW